MNRYTYRHKKTGIKIHSDKPLKNPNLELISEVRDGKIKSNKVIKK